MNQTRFLPPTTLKEHLINDLRASAPKEIDSLARYLQVQWDGFTTIEAAVSEAEELLQSDPDFVFEDDAWWLSTPYLSRFEEQYGSFVLDSGRMDLCQFARQRLSLHGLCDNPAVHPDTRADIKGIINWIDTLVDQIAGKNDNSPVLTTSVPDQECQQIVGKAKTPLPGVDGDNKSSVENTATPRSGDI